MVVRLVLLRTYYFICCLLIASGNVIPPSDTKTSDQKGNNNATKDSIESTTTEVKEAQSVNLKTVSRSRRSNLNSNFNEQLNFNAGENAAFNSAFRYNDQIMRKLLKTHSPNPARSHFFFNLITPLDRRATRYNSWDGHSVMHFGKRSVSEKESDESLTDEKSLYEPDPNISKEDEDPKDIEELESIKRGTDSWTDHNVMHFGKRDEEVLNGEVSPFAETLDEEKKSEDAWHNMMNFGKKSENPWNDHNTMHFGKKDDPWHSMMSFGKKSENPWNDHNTMHFGKREDPWHSMMSFGKKSENSWNDHNTMHFGKREDPWHSMMSFGKKSENPWNDHNTMHFGKREDPWHNMMSFGKKSENSWNDHNTLHFGKREDPWHNMMSFGKKSENPWNDHNTLHFGKREDPWHSMMSFGKKSENSWNDHNTMHFGKKDDPWHSMMSFGKKSENPWNDHNTMHFGKREDPWHNMMSFGKKSENPWNDHNTMHFGKRDDPWHNMMSFGKKSENPWNDHNTLHFGKREDPWHSMMSFGKRSEDFWNDHNTMHFGKREDPWHSMMSFGKKSLTDQKGNISNRETILTTENNTDDHSEFDNDEINNSAPISDMKSMNKRSIHPLESDRKQLKTTKMQYETPTNVKYLVIDDKSSKKDEQNNSEFKAHDQLKSEDQQNFEKKSKLWESHNTIHFGKIDPPFDAHNMYITPSLKDRLKQKPKNSFGRNGNFKLTPNTQNKGMNLEGTEKKLLVKKRSVEEIMPVEKNFDNEDETALQQSGSLNFNSREEFPEPLLQFGKRSPDDNDATDDKKFVPWDILYLTALEQKRDPWESHNTLHFGKRFDPWDLHNTMHFGKKSDPWNYHNTMHFGKKKDPWENHNTMHFGKRSDPWQSHNTMHFGKRSDPWQLHNTMHFGKKSDPWDAHNTMHFGKRFDPWQSHNTMHFGKKSDPWQSHNTMHFGKKSDLWENHNTLHFGKRDSDELPDYADYTNNPEFELDLNDPTSILNSIVLSDKNSLTSLENESNMIAKLLRSRMNEDFPENPTAEDLLFKLLENADKLSKSDLSDVATEQKQEQISGIEPDRNEPRLVGIENVPNRLKSDQPVGRSPDKRYMFPFQGPKSIVYPHAWLVSQIRRSVPPSRQFDLRVAEKKEDPINSYMHFGRR